MATAQQPANYNQSKTQGVPLWKSVVCLSIPSKIYPLSIPILPSV